MRLRIYTVPTFFLGAYVPWVVCPLDDAFLGRCVPWTMRYLDDASLGRCVPWTLRLRRRVRDRFVPRLDRICRWWIISKAGRRKLGFTPDAMRANRGIPSFADITGHTGHIKFASPVLSSPTKPITILPQTQGKKEMSSILADQ